MIALSTPSSVLLQPEALSERLKFVFFLKEVLEVVFRDAIGGIGVNAFAENGIRKDFGSGFLKVYRVCRGMPKIVQQSLTIRDHCRKKAKEG